MKQGVELWIGEQYQGMDAESKFVGNRTYFVHPHWTGLMRRYRRAVQGSKVIKSAYAVGSGNGAFTELIVARCAPAEVHGIDPSEEQLAFARTRLAAGVARFHQGDAMALPFPDDSFDAAVMALVIFLSLIQAKASRS